MMLLQPGWVQEACMDVEIHAVKVTPNLIYRQKMWSQNDPFPFVVFNCPSFVCLLPFSSSSSLFFHTSLWRSSSSALSFSCCVLFSQNLLSLLPRCISLNSTGLTAVLEQSIIHSSSPSLFPCNPNTRTHSSLSYPPLQHCTWLFFFFLITHVTREPCGGSTHTHRCWGSVQIDINTFIKDKSSETRGPVSVWK